MTEIFTPRAYPEARAVSRAFGSRPCDLRRFTQHVLALAQPPEDRGICRNAGERRDLRLLGAHGRVAGGTRPGTRTRSYKPSASRPADRDADPDAGTDGGAADRPRSAARRRRRWRRELRARMRAIDPERREVRSLRE